MKDEEFLAARGRALRPGTDVEVLDSGERRRVVGRFNKFGDFSEVPAPTFRISIADQIVEKVVNYKTSYLVRNRLPDCMVKWFNDRI